MKRSNPLKIRLLVLALLWAVGGFSFAADGAQPIVIVLSWDGMRHDYPDLDAFPTLKRIETEGVRAKRLTPVFPSSTFPGHVSMATGTYPDRHGIVDNVFFGSDGDLYSYSSDASWIQAEPLWIAAERQGVTTATYFWVGSETDWRGQGTSYRIAPFDGSRPESTKVDQILEWLSLPEESRPRLIMSYWAGADSIGHEVGPNHESVISQIHTQDRQLDRLLSGIEALDLWARTTLILVSDHGMTPWRHVLDIHGALKDKGVDAEVVGAAVPQVYLNTPVPDDEMRQVLVEVLADVPGAKIYKGDQLPKAYRLQRESRIGDWVVELPPPYAMSRSTGFELWYLQALTWFGRELGMHGYDPSHPDMGAFFLALGADVPASLDEVHQVDVAATVARILGIDPPRDSEGIPIW